MLSFDRRQLLALMGASAVIGCGFEPVYAPQGDALVLRGAVALATPKTEDDFDLNRQLEQRLGRADSALFGLDVKTRVRRDSLAIEGALDVTRYNLVGTADFALRDLGSGEIKSSGQVGTFTSYSASGSTVSTLRAEQDARQRLMIALADLVVTQLFASSEVLSA